MDGTRGENQYLVNNDVVIISRQSGKSAGLLFLFQPLGAGDEFHHTLDVAGPFGQIRGGLGGVALQGIGEAGGYEGRLPGREFACPGVEEPLGGCFGTKDAPAHFCHIEVHFQDAFFSPYHLNKECKICLKPFPHPTAAGEEEHIFGGLLRNGAGSAQLFPFAVGIHSISNLHPVEPLVGEEPGVFAGHNRHSQVGGNLLHRPPPLVGTVG